MSVFQIKMLRIVYVEIEESSVIAQNPYHIFGAIERGDCYLPGLC